jgi:pantoate--beta-alanine ligase
LSQSLSLASEMVAAGERDADAVLRCMRAHIEAVGGVDIEYVGIVKDGTVTPVQQIDGPVVALVAACVGKTRLIDNRWIE